MRKCCGAGDGQWSRALAGAVSRGLRLQTAWRGAPELQRQAAEAAERDRGCGNKPKPQMKGDGRECSGEQSARDGRRRERQNTEFWGSRKAECKCTYRRAAAGSDGFGPSKRRGSGSDGGVG